MFNIISSSNSFVICPYSKSFTSNEKGPFNIDNKNKKIEESNINNINKKTKKKGVAYNNKELCW